MDPQIIQSAQVQSSCEIQEPEGVVGALMRALGPDASAAVTAEEVFETGLITYEQYRALNQRIKDDDLETKTVRIEFERRWVMALHADLTAICHWRGQE